MLKKYSILLVLSCFISFLLSAQIQENQVISNQTADPLNNYTLFYTLPSISCAVFSMVEGDDVISKNEVQLPAEGNQRYSSIKIKISTESDLSLRLSGKIEFVKYNQKEIKIERDFVTNEELIMDLPEDIYYVNAWIPNNNGFSKTWYGDANVCDSSSGVCSNEIILKPVQFSTLQPELHFSLLEYAKSGLFANSSVVVSLMDQRSNSATGQPIKDVDVTLMKIPPSRACCPVVPPNGTNFNRLEFSKLQASYYFLNLYIADLPIKYNPCIKIKYNTHPAYTLIVKDDGIYLME